MAQQDYAGKAKETFSVERKEDYLVLLISAIVVILVITGAIGPDFVKSLFF